MAFLQLTLRPQRGPLLSPVWQLESGRLKGFLLRWQGIQAPPQRPGLAVFNDLLLATPATQGLVSLHLQGIELLLHALALCGVLLMVEAALQGSHRLRTGHELEVVLLRL